MTDETIPIVPADRIPPARPRANARQRYPWAELKPGEGFPFPQKMSPGGARNACSMNGNALNRRFAFQVDQYGTFWAVRTDGLAWEPGRSADGRVILKAVPDREVFMPGLDDPQEFVERKKRDALCEKLKKMFDPLPLDFWREYVASMEPQIARLVAQYEGGEDAAENGALAGMGVEDGSRGGSADGSAGGTADGPQTDTRGSSDAEAEVRFERDEI
jgi:hypothetical protein